MSGYRMGRCSAESSFWQNRVNSRRWFGYKSSYNREVLRRSVNRNPLRNLVEAVRQCKELLLSSSFTLE
jgi:hypothetical protein